MNEFIGLLNSNLKMLLNQSSGLSVNGGSHVNFSSLDESGTTHTFSHDSFGFSDDGSSLVVLSNLDFEFSVFLCTFRI